MAIWISTSSWTTSFFYDEEFEFADTFLFEIRQTNTTYTCEVGCEMW